MTAFFTQVFGQYAFVAWAFFSGILASIACGLGALPLAFRGLQLEKRVGLGYAFAGGLMFSASVYNLLMPAFNIGMDEAMKLKPVLLTLGGMALGALFLSGIEKYLTPERLEAKFLKHAGGRTGALVFLAMMFHSVPEGVAVGVGYGSETHLDLENFGHYVAIAIGIHNIPEGLAVALPMVLAGASISRAFFYAFLTSLPQPLAAVPAGLMVWFFEPLMLPFLGFAAGAMIFLVLMELIPEALESHGRTKTAWFFLGGFGLMALVQVGL
ncbi:MAG: ZIP family metal transporter [Gemmatimonadetes bacterium]|nr:ZIP family metal transporter [Gemmatimonadota bacterium]